MTGGPRGPRRHLRAWGYDALQILVLVLVALAALAQNGWHL